MSRNRLVLIGPFDARERFVGGATVSFRHLVASISRSGVPFRVVDTRRFSGRFHAPANFIWFLAATIAAIPGARAVMLNGARRGLLYLGPLAYVACALGRVKFCVRPIGGDFAEICESVPAWHRRLLQSTLVEADALFLETRALVERYSPTARRAVWMPNGRPRAARTPSPPAYRKRFVFLSQLAANKGAGVLLDAAEMLGPNYTVDFYGPIRDADLGGRLRQSGRYRGVAASRDVTEVLRAYDVLVMPTFAPEEGIPGAILDAFSIGMPVIATRWRSLPEVVSNGQSGLLVAPNSVDELAAAMRSIDEHSFARLRVGALRAFDRFDCENVARDALAVLLDFRRE